MVLQQPVRCGLRSSGMLRNVGWYLSQAGKMGVKRFPETSVNNYTLHRLKSQKREDTKHYYYYYYFYFYFNCNLVDARWQ
jgi:hypothetical protein